tara:strand:+ start:288 stop:623 length:336 start_codon:yes stop_codon:yes gene_type:complete
MVHKNYKWNLSKDEGSKLVYTMMEKIIKEKKDNSIEINELIFLLNIRSKNLDIRNNNKQKNMSNFIKTVFGGVVKFIDDYDNFLLQKINGDIFIRVNHLDASDWVFVENDE